VNVKHGLNWLWTKLNCTSFEYSYVSCDFIKQTIILLLPGFDPEP